MISLIRTSGVGCREMEPQALKELCRSFLRQRDDARLAESQQRRRVMWLERDVEALGEPPDTVFSILPDNNLKWRLDVT